MNSKKLTKWLRWFEIVRGEVEGLVMAKYTFHEVQGMIRDNPLLHQYNWFYDYLSDTYVSHALIGLRRQIKCDVDSISMARLFEEMIATPEEFPRAYYTAKYKGSVEEDFANKDFDKFAAPGALHIDPNLVAADLARLRTASARCEDFADKCVAHRDKREPKEFPTFNEVGASIDLLDELYVKYLLLFHARTMETLLPVWQDDWQSIFRVPWLSSSEEEI